MKVLSLFDGMACGMLAMMEAGIGVERYVAYEYDETSASAEKGRPYGYAALTASHNFPMIEHRGDVFQADFTEFFDFDGLIGGSPCTYWSIAQKNNRETEASGMGWELFSQYVRALHEAKPKWFIYENNKSMSAAIRASIDDAFGFEAVCINSSLVSAQNRNRLYWVGKRNEDGTYSKVDIEQPEDRGVLLKDILESGQAYREKANCLCGNRGGTSLENDLTGSRHNYAAEPVRVGALPRPNGKLSTSQSFRVYSTEGKSVNLTAQGGGAGAKTGLYAIPVRVPDYGVHDKSRPVTACYAYKGCGEGSLATEAFPDNPNKQVRDYVAEPVQCYATPVQWDKDGKPIKAISPVTGKTYQVFEVKDGLITIRGKQYNIKLKDGFYIIRKLTVKECMRLQTVPEWYEFPVSDSQAYKMLGNGWTVNVIAHILRQIPTECAKPEKPEIDIPALVAKLRGTASVSKRQMLDEAADVIEKFAEVAGWTL